MSRVPSNIHSLHSRDRASRSVSFCAAVYESMSRWNWSVREYLSLLTLLLLITTSLFSECDFLRFLPSCSMCARVCSCRPVQRSSRCDGFWEVVDQRSPAASVNRHGQRLRMVGLQNAKQPSSVWREWVSYEKQSNTKILLSKIKHIPKTNRFTRSTQTVKHENIFPCESKQ